MRQTHEMERRRPRCLQRMRWSENSSIVTERTWVRPDKRSGLRTRRGVTPDLEVFSACRIAQRGASRPGRQEPGGGVSARNVGDHRVGQTDRASARSGRLLEKASTIPADDAVTGDAIDRVARLNLERGTAGRSVAGFGPTHDRSRAQAGADRHGLVGCSTEHSTL
jgi:hypothetical protein